MTARAGFFSLVVDVVVPVLVVVIFLIVFIIIIIVVVLLVAARPVDRYGGLLSAEIAFLARAEVGAALFRRVAAAIDNDAGSTARASKATRAVFALRLGLELVRVGRRRVDAPDIHALVVLAKDPKSSAVVHRVRVLGTYCLHLVEAALAGARSHEQDIDGAGAGPVSDLNVEPARALGPNQEQGRVLTATGVVAAVVQLLGRVLVRVVVRVVGRRNQGQVLRKDIGTNLDIMTRIYLAVHQLDTRQMVAVIGILPVDHHSVNRLIALLTRSR